MNTVTNIVTEDNITSFIYNNKNETRANILRRAILSEIETFTIDIVIFHVNTSPRPDEVLALRLGQLVIDHDSNELVDGARYSINLSVPADYGGTALITTDNLADLKFTYVTPIVELNPGQELIFDYIIKKGQGKTHVKWRPVGTVQILDDPLGFKFSFKNIGMLSSETIIEEGIKRMRDAVRITPISIFSVPVAPPDLI